MKAVRLPSAAAHQPARFAQFMSRVVDPVELPGDEGDVSQLETALATLCRALAPLGDLERKAVLSGVAILPENLGSVPNMAQVITTLGARGVR